MCVIFASSLASAMMMSFSLSPWSSRATLMANSCHSAVNRKVRHVSVLSILAEDTMILIKRRSLFDLPWSLLVVVPSVPHQNLPRQVVLLEDNWFQAYNKILKIVVDDSMLDFEEFTSLYRFSSDPFYSSSTSPLFCLDLLFVEQKRGGGRHSNLFVHQF